VHPGVESAVLSDGPIGDNLALNGVGDVRDDRGRGATARLDLGDERLQSGFSTGRDHDLRTLLGEPERGDATDAAWRRPSRRRPVRTRA
jgi:hypothetical protein